MEGQPQDPHEDAREEPAPPRAEPPAATRDAPAPPAARHALARAAEHWNPFYVLSAFSMLGSCYALEYDFMIGPESLGQIVRPLAALQLYELLVLATAVFLVRSGRAVRDARMLVLIEVPFLVDITYFLGEAAAFDPGAGAWISAGAFVLAVAKLAAVNVGLALPWRRGERAHFVLLLALLHGLPPLLMRFIVTGLVHPLVLHGAWWLVAGALLTKPDHVLTRHVDPALDLGHSIEALFRRAVLHFVHDVPYFRGNAAPLLLAFATLLTRARFAGVTAGLRRGLIVGLPLAAVALDLAIPRGMLRPVPELGDLAISPFWLAVAGSAAVYLLAFLRVGSPRFVGLAAAAGVVAAAGQTASEAIQAIGAHLGDTWHATTQIVPRTVGEWGVIGLLLAFALLAVGIRTSLTGHAGSSSGARG